MGTIQLISESNYKPLLVNTVLGKQKPFKTKPLSNKVVQDTVTLKFGNNRPLQPQASAVAPPSKKFLENVQKAVPQALSTMPSELQILLYKRACSITVVGEDRYAYFEQFNKLSDIMHKSEIKPFLKRILKDMTWKNRLLKGVRLKKALLFDFKRSNSTCAAFVCNKLGMIIFEHWPLELNYELTSEENLPKTIRHEVAHSLDFEFNITSNNYFDSDKSKQSELTQQFTKAATKDYEHLLNHSILPLVQTKNGTTIYQHEKLTEEQINTLLEEFSDIDNEKELFGGKSPFYLIPHNEKDLNRAHAELFAEVFAALYGGGTYPNPKELTKVYFPNTAKYIQEVVIPEILKSA